MHILDGFLPAKVCILGYGITGGMTWYSLYRINRETNPQENIPKASLFTSAFFVASLINIPLGFTSVHLVLNGLMGVILGFYSFPAILIGLFFQAVMFGHGGLSTLGVNAVMMGVPALLAYGIFKLRYLRKNNQVWKNIFAFFAGAGGLGLAATIFVILTITNISADLNVRDEEIAIYIALGGYLIQAIIEGIFTVMLVTFVDRVKPELLENS